MKRSSAAWPGGSVGCRGPGAALAARRRGRRASAVGWACVVEGHGGMGYDDTHVCTYMYCILVQRYVCVWRGRMRGQKAGKRECKRTASCGGSSDNAIPLVGSYGTEST